MNTRSIAYWATTGITAAGFLMGGITDLVRGPEMVANMAHLGYPAYFLLILGTWKVLGAAAIVAPKMPRLKEWAYAGLVFDVTGASLSHAASGDPAVRVVVPLLFLGLIVASWTLRPESRRLADAASAPLSERGRPATQVA